MSGKQAKKVRKLYRRQAKEFNDDLAKWLKHLNMRGRLKVAWNIIFGRIV